LQQCPASLAANRMLPACAFSRLFLPTRISLIFFQDKGLQISVLLIWRLCLT